MAKENLNTYAAMVGCALDVLHLSVYPASEDYDFRAVLGLPAVIKTKGNTVEGIGQMPIIELCGTVGMGVGGKVVAEEIVFAMIRDMMKAHAESIMMGTPRLRRSYAQLINALEPMNEASYKGMAYVTGIFAPSPARSVEGIGGDDETSLKGSCAVGDPLDVAGVRASVYMSDVTSGMGQGYAGADLLLSRAVAIATGLITFASSVQRIAVVNRT